jgi:hypothetical protein
MVALGYRWIVNRDESNWSWGFTYEACPHQDNSQVLIVADVADVAVVANVANVIDIKKGSEGKISSSLCR